MPVRHPLGFAYQKVSKVQAKITQNQEAQKSNSHAQNNLQYTLERSDALRANNRQRRDTCSAVSIGERSDSSLASSNNSNQVPQIERGVNNNQPLYCLDTCRCLANEGQLQEASDLCQDYLRQNPTSAPGYLLMGEIYQAIDQKREAEECWQKAIYLEPNCYEALVHLLLLKEEQGDRAGATVIRQRLQRLNS
ncbi:MAG: hypothetical protein F6K24_44445 [Okeania sp. SIO2D1]|nr:hypothetical protein [Okeania sp. SIO2D1]